MAGGLRGVKVGPGFYNPSLAHALLDEMLCGPQTNIMAVGGSRSGKTFTIVKSLVARARKAQGSHQAILRLHLKDVKEKIGLDTLPKVMRLRFGDTRWTYGSGSGLFKVLDKTIPKEDGSEIWLLGLDDQDRTDKILGSEFCGLYYNECSQLSYGAVLTGMSRLAQLVTYRSTPTGPLRTLVNRVYYDLNPVGTGHFSYSLFIEGHEPGTIKKIACPEDYVFMYVNPGDNEQNLAPGYIQNILERMPELKRKRFFEGRYVAQLEGALWTIEMIEALKLTPGDALIPQFERVVVAVDPSGCSGADDTKADEIGIVVLALGVDGHVYVLEDMTGHYSPEQWGRAAVVAYYKWNADRIVGEKNFGGDMVRAVIQGVRIDDQPVGQNVPYRHVSASVGKHLRAEPIAAMTERKMVHHVGDFALLERELTNFTTQGYKGAGSPNHADAYVWGATELFGNKLAYGLTEYLATKTAEIGKEQEERMQKMATFLTPGSPGPVLAGSLAKLDVVPEDGKQPTAGCPECGAICIAHVSSGGNRCANCGHQWDAPDMTPTKPQNRTTLFK